MAKWRGWLVLLTAVGFLLIPVLRAEQPMTLENADLLVTLSPQHGGLLSVQSKQGGVSYLGDLQQAGWFRIQVPLPHWEGHAAASQDLKTVTVRKRGPDSVELKTSKLQSAEGTYPISFTLTLRLERDNLVCRLSLQNQSQNTVDRIIFPILDVPAAADSSESLVMPHSILPLKATFSENIVRTEHNPFDFLDPIGGWFHGDAKISAKAFNYPDTLPTAWFTFTGDAKGIGFEVRDKQFQYQKFIIERRLHRDTKSREANRRDYELSWNWYPLVRPGATWESPEVYIKFDKGDWHGIAAQHRDWQKVWIRRPIIAPKLKSSIGWMSRAVSSYDEIPAIARQGVEVGAPYFIVYHWSQTGPAGQVYGTYPRADLGGLEALQRNLKKARELGSHPLAWLNATLSGDGTLDHLKQGKNWVVKDRWGGGIAGGQWGYGPNNVVWLEFDPSGSKDLLLDTIRRFIEDYHFSGFEMDQAYKFYASYRDTDNIPPELAFSKGYGDFYTRAAELVKKHDPEGIIVGELYSDWLDQYVDSSWVFNGGPLEMPQLTRLRYRMPWMTVPVRAVATSQGHANQAFMMNAPLDIFDDLAKQPDYTRHLQRLHALKKSTWQYFYEGEFSDGEGFSLQGSGQVVAKSYRNPKSLTVVVINTGGTPQETTLRPAEEFTSANVRRYFMDGRTETQGAASEMPLKLAAFEVQVLAFEPK